MMISSASPVVMEGSFKMDNACLNSALTTRLIEVKAVKTAIPYFPNVPGVQSKSALNARRVAPFSLASVSESIFLV